MDILKKIDDMRTAKGWSIYRLATAADLPQSTIVNMYNRKTLPSITTLECICHAFNVSLSDFFKEDEEKSDDDISSMYSSLTPTAQDAIKVLMKELSKKRI